MTKSVGFEFNGNWITNPYLSECGRFAVDPSYYGFYIQHTGGGCMALQKDLPPVGEGPENERLILITEDDGSSIPDANSLPENILIGLYCNDHSDHLALNTLQEAIDETNRILEGGE